MPTVGLRERASGDQAAEGLVRARRGRAAPSWGGAKETARHEAAEGAEENKDGRDIKELKLVAVNVLLLARERQEAKLAKSGQEAA